VATHVNFDALIKMSLFKCLIKTLNNQKREREREEYFSFVKLFLGLFEPLLSILFTFNISEREKGRREKKYLTLCRYFITFFSLKTLSPCFVFRNKMEKNNTKTVGGKFPF